MFLTSDLSDLAEDLRLPAASRRAHLRPAAGEGPAVGRGRHAALLRHPGDGGPGPDHRGVSLAVCSPRASWSVRSSHTTRQLIRFHGIRFSFYRRKEPEPEPRRFDENLPQNTKSKSLCRRYTFSQVTVTQHPTGWCVVDCGVNWLLIGF